MGPPGKPSYYRARQAFFYGWYIVGVGFLSNLVCAFSLSSTLSVFLKPLTEELGVSRGLFSLMRSGEILLSGAFAPWVGSMVDRYSGRWLMVFGALAAGTGFFLLSQVGSFWQFLWLRWLPVTLGTTFMGYMVVNVAISRWFVRRRGRALAIAALGQGISKVSIPLFAASLFVWLGWRLTWGVFGTLTIALVVGPAFFFMRQRPEDMGLYPDGAEALYPVPGKEVKRSALERRAVGADVQWSRREAVRTQAFWLIVVTFGIANVGIAGLNLHVFAYVTDIGHTAISAATVMSVIAFTQLSSTLFWGFVAERADVRKATVLEFLIQALGLSLAIATRDLRLIYAGFALYGIGMGGSQVLQEVVWVNNYGRVSLGTVRGMGLLITNIFTAMGAPFFGFLFDLTRSYMISFVIFTVSLFVSAFLSLLVRPPQKAEEKILS